MVKILTMLSILSASCSAIVLISFSFVASYQMWNDLDILTFGQGLAVIMASIGLIALSGALAIAAELKEK